MKLLQSFNPTLNGMDSAAMVLFMPEQINELVALLKTFLNQIKDVSLNCKCSISTASEKEVVM